MEQIALPPTMTALRKLQNGPGAKLVNIPLPIFRTNDVLLRVDTASICGTDLHIMEWDSWSNNRIKARITLGHEMAGTIVATGANVDSSLIGDFVS